MSRCLRAGLPPRSGRHLKLRLEIQGAEGDCWDLVVSLGMERFIGSYPLVPGLTSDGALLDFQRVA